MLALEELQPGARGRKWQTWWVRGSVLRVGVVCSEVWGYLYPVPRVVFGPVFPGGITVDVFSFSTMRLG